MVVSLGRSRERPMMVCQAPVRLVYRPVISAARVGVQVGETW